MTVERVGTAHPDPAVIQRAAAILRAGGLVAFPTETVYGLGANALDDAAVRRVFETKGRPAHNPLIVHVPSAADARALAAHWPAAAERLAERFWPGPLTLVVPKRDLVPDQVTATLPTVALRVPNHPVALALLRAAGVPVAAPSANPYTRVSPTTAQHVTQGLESGVDLVLDAGPTEVGIESTVVDVSGERPVLLRPGSISRAELEAVVGPLGTAAPAATEDAPRPSPGMVRQHYSPRAELRLFQAHQRGQMERVARTAALSGVRVGGLLLQPLAIGVAEPVMMPGDPAGYAARLYSALHDLDAAGCALILADAVPEGPEWAGVRDRLARAAREG
ncbi:MAG TPA: L-threonylcarbamoyladenylate synthase [Longimicrobiaceae bacterium]